MYKFQHAHFSNASIPRLIQQRVDYQYWPIKYLSSTSHNSHKAYWLLCVVLKCRISQKWSSYIISLIIVRRRGGPHSNARIGNGGRPGWEIHRNSYVCPEILILIIVPCVAAAHTVGRSRNHIAKTSCPKLQYKSKFWFLSNLDLFLTCLYFTVL